MVYLVINFFLKGHTYEEIILGLIAKFCFLNQGSYLKDKRLGKKLLWKRVMTFYLLVSFLNGYCVTHNFVQQVRLFLASYNHERNLTGLSIQLPKIILTKLPDSSDS